jgi:hypothetical protein
MLLLVLAMPAAGLNVTTTHRHADLVAVHCAVRLDGTHGAAQAARLAPGGVVANHVLVHRAGALASSFKFMPIQATVGLLADAASPPWRCSRCGAGALADLNSAAPTPLAHYAPVVFIAGGAPAAGVAPRAGCDRCRCTCRTVRSC